MTTLAPPLRKTHRFSVDEYERMVEMGIVPEGRNTEFIRGEVVQKMPHGKLHDTSVEFLTEAIFGALDRSVTIRCQSAVRLADSEPEPDLVVCVRSRQRGGRHPNPGETFLVVEVSDSSLAGDRSEKLELFAANGIVEYWIVNLPDECVEVHTRPVASEQRYDSRVVYSRGQNVPLAIAGLPTASIAVDSILP